jgi:hypothetical protein
MTKLLKQALVLLCDLPEDYQDKAARHLIDYVQEISAGDEEALDHKHGVRIIDY